MKERLRTVCDFLLGALFIAAVFAAFSSEPMQRGEYVFVSGLLAGIVLIASGLYNLLRKKRFPIWVYFNCMAAVLAILITTAAVGLGLSGPFWLVHIINPTLMFMYWYAFCDHTELRNRATIATVAIFPALYACFAVVFWKTTGVCPFPASLLLIGQPWYIALEGALATVVVFLIMGYALDAMNRFIYHRKTTAESPIKAAVE